MAGNHYTSAHDQRHLPTWRPHHMRPNHHVQSHQTESPISSFMQDIRMSKGSFVQSSFGVANSRPPPSYNYHWQGIQNENMGYQQQIPVPHTMHQTLPQVTQTVGQPQVHLSRMPSQNQSSGTSSDRFGHYSMPRNENFGAFEQFKITGNGISREDLRNLQTSKSAQQNFEALQPALSNPIPQGTSLHPEGPNLIPQGASLHAGVSNSIPQGASLHAGGVSRWYKMPEETYENGRVVQHTVQTNVQNQAMNPAFQSSLSTSVHEQYPVLQDIALENFMQPNNDGISDVSRSSRQVRPETRPDQIQPRYHLNLAQNGGRVTNDTSGETHMRREKRGVNVPAPIANHLKLKDDGRAHVNDLLKKSLATESLKQAYQTVTPIFDTNAPVVGGRQLGSRPLEKQKIPEAPLENKSVELGARSLEGTNVPEILSRNKSSETVDNTKYVQVTNNLTSTDTGKTLNRSGQSETVDELLSGPGTKGPDVCSEPICQISSNVFENQKAPVLDENSPFDGILETASHKRNVELGLRSLESEMVPEILLNDDNTQNVPDANNLNLRPELRSKGLISQILTDQNGVSETIHKLLPALATESPDLCSKSVQQHSLSEILATQDTENGLIDEPGKKRPVVDTTPEVVETQTVSGKESDLELSSDLYDPPLPVITHKKRQERMSPLKKYGGGINQENSCISENGDLKKGRTLVASQEETPLHHSEVPGKKLRHKSSEVSSSSSPRYDDTVRSEGGKSSETQTCDDGVLKQKMVMTKDGEKGQQNASRTCSLKKTDSQSNDGSKHTKHEKHSLASARDKVYSKWSGSYNAGKSEKYSAKVVGHERRKSCPETDISKPGTYVEKRRLPWHGSESPKNAHPQNKDLASNDSKKSLLPSNGSRVLFHGQKLLRLILSDEKFFVMAELMKCFKGHDSQQVRKTKTCTLKINFVPLTHSCKRKVESYLRSRKISFPSQIEIISVSDAHRLFHYVNKMDFCTDEKCASSNQFHDKDLQKDDAKERSISPDSTVRHQVDKSRSKESCENLKEDSLQDEVQHNNVSSQSQGEGEDILPYISDCDEPEDIEADRLSDSTDIYCEGKPLSAEKTKESVHKDTNQTNDTLVVTKHMKGGYAIIQKPGQPEKQLRFIYVRGEKCYLYQDLFLLFGKESVVKLVIHQLMSIKDCTEDEAEILSSLQPDSVAVDPPSNKLIRDKYVRKIFAYFGEPFPKVKHEVESCKDKTYSAYPKKPDCDMLEALSVSNRTPLKNDTDQQKCTKSSEGSDSEESMEISHKQLCDDSSREITGEKRGTKRLRSDDSCEEPDFKKHLSEEVFNGSRDYILKAFLALQRQNEEMSIEMARINKTNKGQENKSELHTMTDDTKELVESLKKKLGESGEKTTVLEEKCREQEDLLRQTYEDLAKKKNELCRVENERDNYMDIIESIKDTYKVADEFTGQCFGCEEESS